VFQRLTQTEQYWTKDFAIESEDLEHVNNRLLEEERPLSIEELAMAVMRRRVDQEENELRRSLGKGTVYDPSEHYAIGDTLVFPALGFAVGIVCAVRSGSNPEYGEFDVIQVEFKRNNRKREFASGLAKPHALRAATQALLLPPKGLLSVEDLWRQYGKLVRRKLVGALRHQSDLIEMFGLWFVKGLLTEVGVGYLNIAEAILDINGGGPISTSELLKDLGLPHESREELLEYSLNYALAQDERFDEVGAAGKVMWYLRRLEPADVLYPPRRLAYSAVPYDRSLLNLNLRKLETELDDEWSGGWEPAEEPREVTFVLTYPHWRQGTLPLSSVMAPLFPTSYEAPRIRCTLRDSHTQEEIETWVVWEGRFVFGLGAWYRANDLPIGAYLHLSPGSEPGEAVIRFGTRRSQREWVRVAQVQNGQLLFGMQKRSVGCDYDDMMMIHMDDPVSADEVWLRIQERSWSLAETMVRLFPELAKLSPQSTVHAKTLYSAVNMVYRCPPGPIFAELVRQPCFVSMGENYWKFNPNLWSGG